MSLLHVLHRTARHLFTNPPHTNSAMLSGSLPHRLLVLLLALVLVCPTRVQGFGVCRASFRCFNGGVERYGTSIFSPCRCQCKAGYTGPRCQYKEAYGKRSASLNALNEFLLDRLRQERSKLQQQKEEVFYDNHDTDDGGDDDDDDYDNDYNNVDGDSFIVLQRGSRKRSHPKFFPR